MLPSELDLKRAIWTIPGSRTKNGFEHTVPLSPLAIEIIKSAGKPVPSVKVSVAIAKRHGQFGIPHFTAHDCRRTAVTKMAELGISPIVLGHVINHRSTTKAGVTLSVYSHYDYAKEKREALELWASRLQGIISGGADVVAIGRAKR
jgi:integrase